MRRIDLNRLGGGCRVQYSVSAGTKNGADGVLNERLVLQYRIVSTNKAPCERDCIFASQRALMLAFVSCSVVFIRPLSDFQRQARALPRGTKSYSPRPVLDNTVAIGHY